MVNTGRKDKSRAVLHPISIEHLYRCFTWAAAMSFTLLPAMLEGHQAGANSPTDKALSSPPHASLFPRPASNISKLVAAAHGLLPVAGATAILKLRPSKSNMFKDLDRCQLLTTAQAFQMMLPERPQRHKRSDSRRTCLLMPPPNIQHPSASVIRSLGPKPALMRDRQGQKRYNARSCGLADMESPVDACTAVQLASLSPSCGNPMQRSVALAAPEHMGAKQAGSEYTCRPTGLKGPAQHEAEYFRNFLDHLCSEAPLMVQAKTEREACRSLLRGLVSRPPLMAWRSKPPSRIHRIMPK